MDLRAILTDACDHARASAPERTIALAAAEATVVGDDIRLRQAVGNLMRNAIVHTPAGTAIEARLEADPARVALRVVDHGPGLAAEAAFCVFEPFYRADPGRSRHRGGAGLGLAIVAGVVEAHGGRAWVSETPGGGATFAIELLRDPQPASIDVTAAAGKDSE